MKKTVSRLGSAALCVTLSLALGCGCAVMPPASSEKPASSAASVPTDELISCTVLGVLLVKIIESNAALRKIFVGE